MRHLLALAIVLSPAWGQSPSLRDALASLPFRNIGPANPGGRIDDIAVVESDPRIMYVATAAGGVFKTENSGVTFTPLTGRAPGRLRTSPKRSEAKSEPSV